MDPVQICQDKLKYRNLKNFSMLVLSEIPKEEGSRPKAVEGNGFYSPVSGR